MYRILEEHHEVRERRNQLRHPSYAKPELLATAPNELWSWDITKLKGPAKWTYFYLYVILDVFSRYVVGWMVAEKESSVLVRELIEATCERQGVDRDELTLHADRGPSMTSKTVAMLLADLGVTKTHSRPHVSNDNPYSEAQFKTMKYRPDFPERFGALPDARQWGGGLLPVVQPRALPQRAGADDAGTGTLPSRRRGPRPPAAGATRGRCYTRQVLHAPYHATPERFVRGVPRPPDLPEAVWINKPESKQKDKALLH